MPIKSRKLPAELLRVPCKSRYVPWKTSREIPPGSHIVGQQRALRALGFGLTMDGPGYNVFLVGDPGSDRFLASETVAKRLFRRRGPGTDIACVMNFAEPVQPVFLELPKGEGRRLRDGMDRIVRLAWDLAATRRSPQSSEGGRRRREARREKLVLGPMPADEETSRIEELSREKSTTAEAADGLCKTGQPLPRERGRLKRADRKAQVVTRRTQGRSQSSAGTAAGLRIPAQWETTLSRAFARLRGRNQDPLVARYLKIAMTTMVDLLPLMHLEDSPPPTPWEVDDPFRIFRVNLIRDADRSAAPPLVLRHPTLVDLFGSIDRTDGAAMTLFGDFRTIRGGSLLQADRGVVIMSATELGEEPALIRSLLKFLRTNRLTIGAPAAPGASYLTAPIPVSVKVILVGEEATFDQLVETYPSFPKLFKVRAEMDDTVSYTARNVRSLCRRVADLAEKERLPPFTNDALKRLVDENRRQSGRSTMLSSLVDETENLAREAAFLARREDSPQVDGACVERALHQQSRRYNLIEEKMFREIREGSYRVATRGKRVGCVNSLLVFDVSGYTFGKPARITASVAPGSAGVINIEREVNLSGKTHDKGFFILSGYLRNKLKPKKPLAMSASICLEQSYGGIDGDSASLAECLALLSALAHVPLCQAYGVTGALDQQGNILPVGAVNQKIEGFYNVVKQRRGSHRGVIIPAANKKDLMLRPDIVEASRKGSFEVLVVRNVDEALAILAAPVTPRHLFGKAKERLAAYAEAGGGGSS